LCSNVDPEFLKKHLRWEFYRTDEEEYQQIEPVAWAALTNVQASWDLIHKHGLGHAVEEEYPILSFPSDWTVSHCIDFFDNLSDTSLNQQGTQRIHPFAVSGAPFEKYAHRLSRAMFETGVETARISGTQHPIE